MINLEDMIALLKIKDAYDAIEERFSDILGDCGSDPGSPMAELQKIYDFITDRSPLYTIGRSQGINYSDSEYYAVLHSDMPNEEKARKLLMLDDDEMDEEFEEDNTSTMHNHVGFTNLKLEIYIPESHFPQLQEILHKMDAGHIGNYDYCLSYSDVMSTWRPLQGTSPYIGSVGEISQEQEMKVEVTIRAENLEETLSAIRKVHPYEEPVINVIPLLGTGG